jgi:catechol 2,3-dioxygenase-like lactoylglutathione lyase family enzyme
MFKTIEHIAIAAADPAGLARWYCDTLNFRMAVADDESQTYFVSLANGGILEILPANERLRVEHRADDAGIRHIALAVDDFEPAYQTLRNQGVQFVGPHYRSPDGSTCFDFFPDPEGNLLQLVYRAQALNR